MQSVNQKWMPFLKWLLVFIPASIVMGVTSMVIFGEQGLFASSQYETELAEIRLQTLKMQKSNQELEIKLRRLRSRSQQVDLLTAEQLKQSKADTIIYYFSHE